MKFSFRKGINDIDILLCFSLRKRVKFWCASYEKERLYAPENTVIATYRLSI